MSAMLPTLTTRLNALRGEFLIVRLVDQVVANGRLVTIGTDYIELVESKRSVTIPRSAIVFIRPERREAS